LAEDGVIRSGMAAADASVLASEGNVAQGSSEEDPSSAVPEDRSDHVRDEL